MFLAVLYLFRVKTNFNEQTLGSMDEFKLIAIRPLARCSKAYLRILKANTPYIFYNQYDFSCSKLNWKQAFRMPWFVHLNLVATVKSL
ncbi:hypothetical protein AQF98_15120 [Pedobacter sp. Hv1]|nr:hypothetical protein AQF98_15120 [Pedobacter sp. Hv1]